MANNENLIPIPGRLHSVATEGHVSGADEIYDDTQQKDQATINSELIAAIGTGSSVDSKIAAAKAEIIGSATSACDTLGEAEALISAEASARQSAISNVIGDAATDYNTLGKLEDKIQAEASARESAISAEATRAEAAEEALDGRIDTIEDAVGTGGSVDSRISAAVATETTRAQGVETSLDGRIDTLEENVAYLGDNDGSSVIADFDPQTDTVWKKAQTLSAAEKEQVQQNIGVREWLNTLTGEKYVSVAATDQTTTSNLKALIDTAAGSAGKEQADTIYRVGKWDGSAYNEEYYSDYAWDGSAYVQLNKKSIVGEVFDITEYKAGTKYDNLAAALGTNGENVPQNVKKGGMSVKYVNTDNKYVQFRYMSSSTAVADFTNVANWQGVDDEPIAGSDNLVKSGGVYNVTSELETRTGARKIVRGEGFNDNLVTISIPVEAGNSYRIIPQEKTWDVSTVGSTSLVFGIAVGNRSIVEIRKANFTSIADFYDFNVQPGETNAYIYFRAVRYKVLKFTVVNKTLARTDYDENVELTNLLDTIISLTQTVEKISLTGKDSTRVAKDFIVPANEQYYVVPMRNTWPISDVASGNHVFSIEPTNIDILNTPEQQTVTINDYYKLPVQSEDTTYTLVIRANSGESVTMCVACASNEDDKAILARIIGQTNTTLDDHNNKINSILSEKPKYDNNVIDNDVKNTSLFNTPQIKSIIGRGTTGQTITYELEGNKSYYLIPKDTTWAVSSISNTSTLVAVSVNNEGILVIKKTSSVFVMPELVKINAVTDCDAVVYVRADSGTKVEFLLIEASENINKFLLTNKVSSLVASVDTISENIVFKDYHTFTGAGGTTQVYTYPIKNGYKYTVSMSPSVWDVSSLSSSSAVFWITVNGTDVYGFRKSEFIKTEDYTFVANANGTVVINLRANTGVKVTSIITDTSKTKIDDIEERINETDILNLHPKEQIIPVLANFKKNVNGDGQSYGAQNLVLLHFSDLHSEVKPLQRLIRFRNKFSSYIDDTILTGDIVDRQSDDFSFWTENNAENILTCIGNHEILVYGDSTPSIDGVKLKEPYLFSGKYCYERYLAPFVSSTGITIETNKSYWYKDYPNNNIRIIALDYMHWKDTPELVNDTPVTTYPDGGSVDTGEQKTWFATKLEEARQAGYAVIVLDHSTPRIGTRIQCSFNSLSSASLNDPHWSEVTEEVETFITNGGEFITYLCGHTHVDQIGTVQGHPNQLTMTIDTSRVDLLNGDIKKIHNTNSEDLFNMVCVNTNMKLLTFFRIGSNWDRYGRPITSLVINYQTKSIMWNS